MVICSKFKKEYLQPLTLYTSFHDLINVSSRRSGADNPRGQTFDVNKYLFSLRSFATSYKKISLKSDFIHFFFIILYMYITPGQGLTTPWGWNFDVNRNILSFQSFAASSKKIYFEVWFYEGSPWIFETITILSKWLIIIQNNLFSHEVLHTGQSLYNAMFGIHRTGPCYKWTVL